jgi:valyl-tRNA synthetase
VRDHEGQKMSKSKGNILDPIDLIDGVDLATLLAKRTEGLMQPHLQASIEKATRKEFPDGIEPFGADAVRFTFASLATTGRDARFDLSRADGYHRFCNKLWNASAYVLSHLRADDGVAPELGVADRWIRSRLRQTIHDVHESFAAYRLDLVAQTLYDFVWHELCDWYLELTKVPLTDPAVAPAEASGARQTLGVALGTVLKLLHPLIPFITEELWLELTAKLGVPSETIMLEPFPEADAFAADPEAEDEVAWLKGFVVGLRQIRGDANIGRGTPLAVKLAEAGPLDRARVARHSAYLKKLAGLSSIEFLARDASDRGSATALLGGMRILVSLTGVIDVAGERDRLGKQLARTRDDLAKSARKLDNADFVANAPAVVVEKERARVDELTQRAAQLEQQLARLADLS